jgi:HEPN domain-containing protein
MSVPPDVRAWLEVAEQDYGLALLIVRRGLYLGQACYHAQQAAEKYLKAVLVGQGVAPPYTHDLVTLAGAAGNPVRGLAVGDLLVLNPYATLYRYPGMPGPPSLSEARAAVQMAGRVRRLCQRSLGLR